MRLRGVLFTLAALTATAVVAHAGAIARSVDRIGSDPLPVSSELNASPDERALVAAARAMPAAQIAMQSLADAGYVRADDADLARREGTRNCVSLGYLDPANPNRAALVIVQTDSADPTGRVIAMAGVFDVDLPARTVQLASGVPDNVECVVTATNPTGTRPAQLTVEKRSARDKLVRWLACTSLGCTAGHVACVYVGMLFGPLAPTALAGCTIAVCAVFAFGCIE